MEFLANQGTLYKVYNENLLFHGCLPTTPGGDFAPVTLQGVTYRGKALMERFEQAIKASFVNRRISEDYETDLIWYLWCGPWSPLFGKHAMKTFERYFLADKKTHKEIQSPYYTLREEEDFCYQILEEFGVDPTGYIINGHTPVKATDGEKPIKANGKMLVIDGGLAKPYQKVTGIAGYTLVDNSHEIYICAHEPFTTRQDAIKAKRDIKPKQYIVTERSRRYYVLDTDIGRQLTHQADSIRRSLPPYPDNILGE